MWDYSDKVKEHYLHPHNVGEVENPDGVGETGSIKCGDALRLTFKLDKNGKISEAKFKTFGCGSAIASSSVLTDMLIGKTIEEARKISNQQIADELEGLPPEKMHCSVMGEEALEMAIQFYENGGKPIDKKENPDKIVCSCFNITDKDIIHAIKENNLTTVEEITNFTKAGGGCGGCLGEIETILVETTGHAVETKKGNDKPAITMTTIEKVDKIRTVIEENINPLLMQDGGGCELVDVDGNNVSIKFLGACHSCSSNTFTQTAVV